MAENRGATVITVVMVSIVLVLGVAAILAAPSFRSGPGCEGDPTWLGWCSEVDGR